jgi:thioester reductase-like protein
MQRRGGAPVDTILDYLDHWVAAHPDKCFSSFLDREGKTRETYTYSSFEARTRFLAEYLREETGLRRGDRVLLVYSPGLEMVAAFVAGARIGAIPVPVPPTTLAGASAIGSPLQMVLSDSNATLVLTDRDLLSASRRSHGADEPPDHEHLPAPRAIRWVATDRLGGAARGVPRDDPVETLFLQYTSGSTGAPKGVVVSHENVIHNCRSTTDHQPIGVSWLPQFHDMGLIGYYLFLIVTGGTTYGFSPHDFLRRPVLWLETLSQRRGTMSSSPNFGFEYCLSQERLPDDQLAGLDLSSVRVLMNGSEPVRPSTYRRFLERFAPYGLRPEAHVAAYGLAENTLAVTGRGRRAVTIDRRSLHTRAVDVAAEDTPPGQHLELVSCGRPLDGIHVRIVDPDDRTALGGDEIGEIWIAGRSTCHGYWNKPELSAQVFGNSIANDPNDRHPYLRTGDLGFLHDGELFVCGRVKDVVILRGRNHYAEDLESAVEQASEKVQAGSVVAFRGPDWEERLVLVVGLTNVTDPPNPDEVTRSLRLHGYDGPHTIVFVRRQAIARTTSGKVTRNLTRDKWLNGRLRAIETHVRNGDTPILTDAPDLDLRSRYERLLEAYALTGDENARLTDVGLDSVAIVQLLIEMERVVDERDAPGLREALDLPLLQRLTISQITAVVRKLEEGDAEWLDGLQTAADELKRERDESDSASMRQDAQLSVTGIDALPPANRSFENVLFTGGTGFLGPFLLRSLLDQTEATYTVLVRAPDPQVARERLRTGLREAGLYDQTVATSFETRVNAICGDLVSPRLGLSDRAWSRLAEAIDTIIHNAALVNYILDYDTLRPHNVEGTFELIKLASTSRRKQFHLISSTIIFGWSAIGNVWERDSNLAMSALDFGYAQTKWVAEQLALGAREQGLDTRIYRPSILTASTAGFGHSEDVAVRLLSFMINYGVAPNTLSQLSLMPVDIAAHNMVAVMASARPEVPAFHVTVDDYYGIMDVTQQITLDYGIPFRYVDLEDFAREMSRLCSAKDPAFPLLDLIARYHSKIASMEHKRYRNTGFREALKQSGHGVPNASLRETVSYLMAHMYAKGLIHLH